jgi:RNA polymerase sigma factor (sigma-70 family)
MDDDAALLKAFAQGHSEPAFAELVRRHVDMVYSAARRQTRGDDALTEDVTQAVFVTLAQKAQSIRQGEAVAGWLLVTTRYVALNALRSEARRRHHEREAAAMKGEAGEHDDPKGRNWNEISHLLDEAVAKLKREDRDALAMRFFQGRSIAQVGAAMGISTEAAQKRVTRAVQRLRGIFAARGIVTSDDALASMLGAHLITSAPAALKAAIATKTFSSAAATSSLATAKGLVAIMAATKTNLVAVGVAAALLLGVTGTIAYQLFHTSGGETRQVKVNAATQSPTVFTPTSIPTTAPSLATNWQPRFREAYGLAPGQIVKFVPMPWIPERQNFYYQNFGRVQYNANPLGPDLMTMFDDGKLFEQRDAMFDRPSQVEWVIEFVMEIPSWDLRGPQTLLQMPIAGDWVIRKGSTQAERVPEFVQQINQHVPGNLTLTQSTIPRQAIVVRGTLDLHPLKPHSNVRGMTHSAPVILYQGTTQPAQDYYAGSKLPNALAAACRMPVVMETNLGAANLQIFRSATLPTVDSLPPAEHDRVIGEILANLTKQTSLQFSVETRTLPVWTVASDTTTQPSVH